jgi:hypothetical protein
MALVTEMQSFVMELTLRISEDMQAHLKTQAVANIGGDSANELLAALLDFAWRLDQLSWPVWNELCPDSGFGPSSTLQEIVSKYLNGGKVSREELRQNLDRTRRLVVGLLTAIAGPPNRPVNSGSSGGIHNYARDLSMKLSPDDIRSSAELKWKWWKKWYESLDQVCWRNYQDRAAELTDIAIENGLKKGFAMDALSWIQYVPPANPTKPCQT